MSKYALALILGLIMILGSASAQTVIQDTGRTVPSVQYFSHLLHSVDSSEESPLIEFPVSADGMRVGMLNQTATLPNAQWLSQPIFIIGSDETSKAWLQQHQVALTRMNATGVVVSVPDVATFKSMRRWTDVTITPNAAPGLVATLKTVGVTVYPILILADGMVVQDLSQWETQHQESTK